MAKMTEAEKAALKELPILGYLDWTGVAYKRLSSNTYNLVDHDSLVIRTNRNAFYWNSRGVGGDLVDFIQNYEGVSKSEAFTRRLAYARYTKGENVDLSQYKVDSTQPRVFDFDKWRKSNNTDVVKKYLVETRNFNPTFVDRLINAGFIQQGVPHKDKQTGQLQQAPALFVWYDENGKAVGTDVQGTTIDYNRFGKRGTEKGIGGGSDDKYGFNFKFGDGGDRIYAFETPIDALSYVQQNMADLAKENATIVSMSGLKQNTIYQTMNRVTELNGRTPNTLVVATDKDQAGYQFASRLLELEGINYIRRIPNSGKDWNEQLQAGANGYQDMSLEDSNKRLATIEAWAAQSAQQDTQVGVEEVAKKSMRPAVEVPKDDHQITKGKHAANHRRTAETQAARRERSRKANEAIVKDAIQKVRNYADDPKKVKEYLEFIAKGLRYSPRNSLLIHAQRPESSLVKGFKQWQDLGIQVNKGEVGMRIFGAPVDLKTIVDDNGKAIYWRDASDFQKAAAQAGKLKVTSHTNYPIETVFDVKQTNATMDQLPELLPNRPINLATDNSTEELQNAYDTLVQFAGEHGVTVFDKNTTAFLREHSTNGVLDGNGMAKGVFRQNFADPDNSQILLRDDLPLTDKVSTLAHEIGHAMLHRGDKASDMTRGVRELQAEMTSFVILKNLGIEPGDVSEKYMHDWIGDTTQLFPQHTLKGANTTIDKINQANERYNSKHQNDDEAKLPTNISVDNIMIGTKQNQSDVDPNKIVAVSYRDPKNHKLNVEYFTPEGFQEYKADFDKKNAPAIDSKMDVLLGEVTQASTEVTNYLSERLTKGKTAEYSESKAVKKVQQPVKEQVAQQTKGRSR